LDSHLTNCLIKGIS